MNVIVEKDLDMLCLIETRLWKARDDAVIEEMTPPGFTLCHSPRVIGRGGGVALIFR